MQISKLPYSELQVMQFIWSQNKKTPSKDVILEMEEKNSWKQTTTLTLISRLIKRDFLSVEKIGRYSYYEPKIAEKDYILNFGQDPVANYGKVNVEKSCEKVG